MWDIDPVTTPLATQIQAWISQYRHKWEGCARDFNKFTLGFQPLAEFLNHHEETVTVESIPLLVQEFENQIGRNFEDIVPRLVAIELFRSLLDCRLGYTDDHSFFDGDGVERNIRIECREALHYLTSLCEPTIDRITEEPRILWELVNAQISCNEHIAGPLFERLRQLGTLTVQEIDALEGAFWFSFVYAPRVDLNITDGRLPSSFERSHLFTDGRLPSSFEGLYHYLDSISAFNLETLLTRRAMNMDRMKLLLWSTTISSKLIPSLADGEQRILEDAVRLLSKGVKIRDKEAWEYIGLLGRALFDLGHYSEAFKAFNRLRLVEPFCQMQEIGKFIRLAMAECLVADGQLDAAEETLISCHDAFPHATGVCRALAEVQMKRLKYNEAFASFRNECDLDSSLDDPWTSMLLVCGNIAWTDDWITRLAKEFKRTSPVLYESTFQTPERVNDFETGGVRV